MAKAEHWIPAADLPTLNAHIVGIVEEAPYRGPVSDREFTAADKVLSRSLPAAWGASLQAREGLVLDLRSEPAPVLSVDITSDGWQNGIRQADDVSRLIDRIEAGTFAFTFADGTAQV